MNLNKFYQDYSANPIQAKADLIHAAIDVLYKAVQDGYYHFEDLAHLNYSEVTDWLDWPDFQDGGLFEQTIDHAANAVLGLLGYKPQHFIDIE